MKKTNKSKAQNLAILIVPLLLIALFLTGCSTSKEQVVTVTGESSFDVMPDTVTIQIAVETLSDSAEQSKTKNAEITNKVIDKLKAIDITKDEIETVNYNMYEDFEYNYQTGKRTSKGWKVVNTVQVKTNKLDKIGDVIDAATDAGATNIRSVYFTLSDNLKAEQKAIALKKAGESAKEKAQGIAGGLGLKLGKIVSVQEANVGYNDYYPVRAMGATMVESASMVKSTPISPNKVTMNGRIVVKYQIK